MRKLFVRFHRYTPRINPISKRLGASLVTSLLFSFIIIIQPIPASAAVSYQSPSFYNPIISGPDPSIYFKDGFYYLAQSSGKGISIVKSATISGLGRGQRSPYIWTAPATGPSCCNVWSPHINYLSGKWYVYFAADDGQSYANHKIYALQANTADPMGTYTFKGKMADSSADLMAIDPTVLQKSDSSLYMAWSGIPSAGSSTQQLYVAGLSNPWTLSTHRVNISVPYYSWETSAGRIQEAPEFLVHNGQIMIVYSANGSWTDDYNLGLLYNTTGNPLDAAHWFKKSTPIFSKTSTVFGPGSATFTTSPNGSESWMLYHATDKSGSGWNNRSIRAQKFSWYSDNTPNLGTPISSGISRALPAGESLTCGVTCNSYFNWGSSNGGDRVMGGWNRNSASNTGVATLDPNVWDQIFLRIVPSTSYTFSADALWFSNGTDAYAKYGIYGSWVNTNNYVAAFINKNHNLLGTMAVVNGTSLGWQNTYNINLDYSKAHNLKIVRNGANFTFYLDGAQIQTRTANIPAGQPGLVTEDTSTGYSNVTAQ